MIVVNIIVEFNFLWRNMYNVFWIEKCIAHGHLGQMSSFFYIAKHETLDCYSYQENKCIHLVLQVGTCHLTLNANCCANRFSTWQIESHRKLQKHLLDIINSDMLVLTFVCLYNIPNSINHSCFAVCLYPFKRPYSLVTGLFL